MISQEKNQEQDNMGLPAHIPRRIARIIERFARESKIILSDELIAEYLFGSYASNTYSSLSDIDILILVNSFRPEIRREMSRLASDFSLEYDVYISPVIKGRDVWEKNQRYHTLFYTNVTQEGIPL